MAHSSRSWRGARTPSALKRVRQSARRRAVTGPRISETKTLVSKALRLAAAGEAEAATTAVRDAVSALDKAAKVGAIHDNTADRRKSRLMLKVNQALGGAEAAAPATARTTRATGKAQAAKETRARIAASKAAKAKGEQTAAGKARAALSRSTRQAPTPAPAPADAAEEPTAAKAPATRTRRTASKTGATGAAPTARTGRATKAAASGEKPAPKPRTTRPKS